MRFFISVLSTLLLPLAAIAGDVHTYQHNGTTLEGYVAMPEKITDRTPAVIIAHQWKGLGDYEKIRADMLAQEGYIAFAADVYGKGIRPDTYKAAAAESSKYKKNPGLARGRMQAALDYVRTLPEVDPNNIAVMGYCFGGTMALELARAGADVRGVISFHGGLSTEKPAKEGNIQTPIVAHHGAADPHVPDEEVAAFKEEMRSAKADWHFISYADAVHAFTEKASGNDPSTGVAYNAKADKRSWMYTLGFLKQIFKKPTPPTDVY